MNERPDVADLESRDWRLGMSVTHRRYVSAADAHYGGNLVDGAYVLGLFGDVATEVCIRSDGDEGLFAGYASIRFLAPVRGGDIVEASATVVEVGRTSRTLRLQAVVVCRAAPEIGASASAVLTEPLTVVEAVGTVVVPVQ
ncbi:MAG: MaoC family dehydratase [Actinomycetota bacterium]